jgi:hypothetical protein
MNCMSHTVQMKHPVSTSLDESEMARVAAIKNKLNVSESWVVRRAVLQGLAEVEKEVLGMSPAPLVAVKPTKTKAKAA